MATALGRIHAVPAGETLLLVEICNAYGVVIIKTIWATTPDLQRGHRRTDSETITTQVALLHRLAELGRVLAGYLPAAAAVA